MFWKLEMILSFIPTVTPRKKSSKKIAPSVSLELIDSILD
jgi:hypothetical protein